MALHRRLTFSDKKTTYVFSFCLLTLLVLAFLFFQGNGRIACAALVLPAAVIASVFIKKRSILSIRKRSVLLIMSVMGLLYITLYYLTGLVYGLYYALVPLSVSSFLNYILPISAIIVGSEMVRSILLAQDSRVASAVAYLICFVAELLMSASIASINTFNQFADILGYTVLPAVTANVLYHYLAKRYGKYPNISYRLLITLFPYVIPYSSQLSAAIYSFARLLVPLFIYLFVHALYEKKDKRHKSSKGVRWMYAVVTAFVLLMTSFIMLVSCQFRYGLVVIATESMTGEINKGDAILYTRYDGQTIEEGQVIVFERNKNKVIHRVVDVQNIDGVVRYYTKGDANKENDAGYVTSADIIGLTDHKIPYIGLPTIWIRDIFS